MFIVLHINGHFFFFIACKHVSVIGCVMRMTTSYKRIWMMMMMINNTQHQFTSEILGYTTSCRRILINSDVMTRCCRVSISADVITQYDVIGCNLHSCRNRLLQTPLFDYVISCGCYFRYVSCPVIDWLMLFVDSLIFVLFSCVTLL